jgi:hypothetical protein
MQDWQALMIIGFIAAMMVVAEYCRTRPNLTPTGQDQDTEKIRMLYFENRPAPSIWSPGKVILLLVGTVIFFVAFFTKLIFTLVGVGIIAATIWSHRGSSLLWERIRIQEEEKRARTAGTKKYSFEKSFEMDEELHQKMKELNNPNN